MNGYGLWKSFWNITLDLVTLESMQKHFRTVRHYTFAYLDVPGGSDLEKLVINYKKAIKSQNYKKAIKSHRRISEIQ